MTPTAPIAIVASGKLTDAEVAWANARYLALEYPNLETLAEEVGVHPSTMSKILNRKRGTRRPVREKLVAVLSRERRADPFPSLVSAPPVVNSAHSVDTRDVTGAQSGHRPITNAQLFEPRPRDWPRAPLYEWGTCGTPGGGNGDEAVPIDWIDYPADEGVVRMIGPAGFAVRVQGDSMARWGLEPGDIVWINPRQGASAGLNRPVLARILDDTGGDMGMAVKVLRQNAEGVQHLESDGDGPIEVIPAGRFQFLGVAVWREPYGRTLRRQLPDRSGESESVRFLGEGEDTGAALTRRAG